jgi:hypothetical protein
MAGFPTEISTWLGLLLARSGFAVAAGAEDGNDAEDGDAEGNDAVEGDDETVAFSLARQRNPTTADTINTNIAKNASPLKAPRFLTYHGWYRRSFSFRQTWPRSHSADSGACSSRTS